MSCLPISWPSFFLFFRIEIIRGNNQEQEILFVTWENPRLNYQPNVRLGLIVSVTPLIHYELIDESN